MTAPQFLQTRVLQSRQGSDVGINPHLVPPPTVAFVDLLDVAIQSVRERSRERGQRELMSSQRGVLKNCLKPAGSSLVRVVGGMNICANTDEEEPGSRLRDKVARVDVENID